MSDLLTRLREEGVSTQLLIEVARLIETQELVDAKRVRDAKRKKTSRMSADIHGHPSPSEDKVPPPLPFPSFPPDPPNNPTLNPPPQKSSRAKPKRALQADWRPRDADWLAAKEKLNGRTEGEFAKFCNHHTAKGSVFVDWDAAWRYWVGNCKETPRGNGEGGRSNGNSGFIQSVWEDIQNGK